MANNPIDVSGKDADDNRSETANSAEEAALDLTDSASDRERLKPESVVMDLPEVKDIPGQEHITVPPLGELADVTIASDDEEGLFLDEEEDDLPEMNRGTTADVTSGEKATLQAGDNYMPTEDDDRLQQAALDNTDEDGTPLNESGFGRDLSGDDLDVPGSGADAANESMGEEDEENNNYSLGSEDNDAATESTP